MNTRMYEYERCKQSSDHSVGSNGTIILQANSNSSIDHPFFLSLKLLSVLSMTQREQAGRDQWGQATISKEEGYRGIAH